jgi:hypothetical protein
VIARNADAKRVTTTRGVPKNTLYLLRRAHSVPRTRRTLPVSRLPGEEGQTNP